MIVENGSVTLNLDLNGLNGSSDLTTRPVTLQFAAGTNSFLPILVLNDQLRGLDPGSIALVPQGRPVPLLPPLLAASLKQLVVEKLPSDAAFDLAVRDGRTGLIFFNVEGNYYDYDPHAALLSITGGNLLVSKDLANALGRPSDAGAMVGKISVGATMQPIEIRQLENGQIKSVTMPPLRDVASEETPTLVPGPDVIVGDMPNMSQFGSAGTQVGLAVATTSCNNGTQPLHWFSSPDNDHPVIPQNLYRMSGGDNERRALRTGWPILVQTRIPRVGKQRLWVWLQHQRLHHRLQSMPGMFRPLFRQPQCWAKPGFARLDQPVYRLLPTRRLADAS